MNCTNCGKTIPGPNMVEGGFCSVDCRALYEHEEKLRENENLSILVSTLDDGGASVQLNLRQPEAVQEMTRRYDSLEEALRGIAALCTSIADGLKDHEGDE